MRILLCVCMCVCVLMAYSDQLHICAISVNAHHKTDKSNDSGYEVKHDITQRKQLNQ